MIRGLCYIFVKFRFICVICLFGSGSLDEEKMIKKLFFFRFLEFYLKRPLYIGH